MTMHLYFARRFLVYFLGLTAIFFILLVLFDLMEQLRRFSVQELGIVRILQMLVLNVPKELYQIFPLIMILSSLVLFLNLARSSELIVARASGRSGLLILLAPVSVALGIGLFGVTTMNPIVAATTKQYDQLALFYRTGASRAISIGSTGLWLRQGGEDGQTVIYAHGSNHDASVLVDVDFVTYGDGGGPSQRIRAAQAELRSGEWLLTDAKIWPLDRGINSEAQSETRAKMTVSTTLTSDQIRDSFGKPRAVSVWELPKLIDQLEEAGFSARRHQMWLQLELSQPVFLVAMVLVAAAFTMGHTRMGRTGLMSLAATLSGFGLYYIRNFARILGENGQIPIELAAWAPPLASVLLALGLVLHMEDG
ncbi:LPS export ABC transporter permease LptG [Cognatishimia sp.]|uniref:LPS export ABC transporter permease LptG n=1 Tax=Cognatishimia sp. TaxID=2211648 RepID=UPI003515107F|nr:LPS export ABC transporter permease LptG [Cognatishimia sp.]